MSEEKAGKRHVHLRFKQPFPPTEPLRRAVLFTTLLLPHKWWFGLDPNQRARSKNVKTSKGVATCVTRQEGIGAKAIADHIDRHDRHDHRHFMGEADYRHRATDAA